MAKVTDFKYFSLVSGEGFRIENVQEGSRVESRFIFYLWPSVRIQQLVVDSVAVLLLQMWLIFVFMFLSAVLVKG